MVPMFRAREQEAQTSLERIQGVKQQLNEIKAQMGIKEARQFHPSITTHFMSRKRPVTREGSSVVKPSVKSISPQQRK